jgi:hypothetical protein
MPAHKFQVGQFVRITPSPLWAAPAGRYEIVRLMPPQGANNQYRVKFVDDGHERMVKESDLT